jgi:hypothetical protein
MLSMDDKLNFKTIAQIFKSGFSRVPIYGEDKDDIQGLLFTKDLIFIDPEDDTPVQQFVQVFGRSCITTHPAQTLGKLLKQLKSGRSHMALVQQMATRSEADGGLQYSEQVGVCTLEDVIEEILQDEIIDETDVFKQMNAETLEGVDRDRKGPLDRAKEQSQANTMLRLLDSRIVDDRLSSAECRAVSAHLMLNYSHIFGRKPDGTPYTKHEVEMLIYDSHVVEYPPIKEDGTPRFLYHKDQINTFCTVVLTGKVEINAGKELFQSFCGPWTVLAAESLDAPEGGYAPDFSAQVRESVRCIRIAAREFASLADPSLRVLEQHGTVLTKVDALLPKLGPVAQSVMMHGTRTVSDGFPRGGKSGSTLVGSIRQSVMMQARRGSSGVGKSGTKNALLAVNDGQSPALSSGRQQVFFCSPEPSLPTSGDHQGEAGPSVLARSGDRNNGGLSGSRARSWQPSLQGDLGSGTFDPSLKIITEARATNPIEHSELHKALQASEQQPGMRIKFVPPEAK